VKLLPIPLKKNKNQSSEKDIKSYIIHIEPTFDEELQKQYLSFFNEKGMPNDDLSIAVFDLCRSIPHYNKNYIGMRKEVLEKSYQSIMYKLGDKNHRRDLTVGFTLNSELIPGLTEDDPIIMRICAAFWKDRLLAYDINSISSQNGFSMEINIVDWEFLINDQIYTRQEKPGITVQHVDDLIFNGIPIYDSDGNLVVLLAGTLEKPINFKGFGVITDDKNPADRLSNVTYFEAASEKTNEKSQETLEKVDVKSEIKDEVKQELINEQNIENKDGEVKIMASFKIFETEEEYNAAINAAKLEVKTEYDTTIVANLNKDLETANGNIAAKDTELGELRIKASDFEGKYNSELERSSGFESKLKTIQCEQRKQVLASKNLSADIITKKATFIETASDNDFNDYVAELDIYATLFGKPAVVKEVVAKEVVAAEKDNIKDLIFPLTDDGKEQTKNGLPLELGI
jgi:hypothetical protein